MRKPFVILALLLTLPTLADAGLRAKCRRFCGSTISDCVVTTAQRRRACKRQILRRCRREGAQVCAPMASSTTTTTTTLPACSSSSCGSPCDASCGTSSLCAPELGCSAPQHLGSGDVCVDRNSCSGPCLSDGDCSAGKVCIGAIFCTGFLGVHCISACCSPCPSNGTCYTSQAPTCGGTCPSGRVCGQVSGGNSCVCVLSERTCDISQAPACGGMCPSGLYCGPVSGGNSCECGVCNPALPCPFVTKWGSMGSGDGQFDGPIGLAVDRNGNVFVADILNHRIQKFDKSGTFMTQWGSLD